jgi:bacteriocin-like protein
VRQINFVNGQISNKNLIINYSLKKEIMKKLFNKKKDFLSNLSFKELQSINGGTTCPSMGDYYAAGIGGFYVGSFWKGVIRGIVSHF